MKPPSADRKGIRRGNGDRRFCHLPITEEQVVGLLADKEAGPRRKGLKFLMDHRFHKDDDCLIWPLYKDRQGYGRVGLDRRVYVPHRIMCVLAHGQPPTPDHVAAHLCGQGYRGCCNPKHLMWATEAENIAHKLAHGRVMKGVTHYRSKLSEDDVRGIRAKTYKRGDIVKIARAYGVSHQTIVRVLKNTSYRFG